MKTLEIMIFLGCILFIGGCTSGKTTKEENEKSEDSVTMMKQFLSHMDSVEEEINEEDLSFMLP